MKNKNIIRDEKGRFTFKNKSNFNKKEIINLYINGLSLIKIAEICKCSASHISNILKENNINLRLRNFQIGHKQFNSGRTYIKKGQHLSPQTEFKSKYIPKKKLDEREIVELYKDKICKEIGRIYGVNYMKIYRLLKKNNVNTSQKGKTWDKFYSVSAFKKMKKLRAKQILPKQDTKIEVKIQNFLKQLGIEFFTHQRMSIKHSYQCDILIPSMNLVIECDGNYWHKYPIGTDIDHIRTSELLEKGFKVLRLWENEINEMTINTFQNKLNLQENL